MGMELMVELRAELQDAISKLPASVVKRPWVSVYGKSLAVTYKTGEKSHTVHRATVVRYLHALSNGFKGTHVEFQRLTDGGGSVNGVSSSTVEMLVADTKTASIQEISVLAATDRTVTIKGKRHSRLGAETSYFTAFADAKQWLLASLRDEQALAAEARAKADAVYQEVATRLQTAEKLKVAS